MTATTPPPLGLIRAADRLLAALSERPGRTYTKDELLRATRVQTTRALGAVAVVLDKRLRDDPSDVRRCQNVWGVGYRLLVPVDPVCECGVAAIIHKGFWTCDEPTCSGYGEILREARPDEIDRLDDEGR